MAIVAVNLQEKPAQVEGFVRKQAWVSVLLDTEAKVAGVLCHRHSTTFFIDREGQFMVHRNAGL